MKKIIFFDVDNTIYREDIGTLLPNMKKLFKELSERKDTKLGIATGRGIGKLEFLKDCRKYFSYFVCANGAYVKCDEKVIYQSKFKKQDLKYACDISKKIGVTMGVSSIEDEELLTYNKGDGWWRIKDKTVNENYYLNNPIYQAWITSKDEKLVEKFIKMCDDRFIKFPWNKNGCDLTYKNNNKFLGIKKILDKIDNKITLITCGDSYNDYEMIKNSDISIAINTAPEEIRKKATYIGPTVDKDTLYDLFKEIKLL